MRVEWSAAVRPERTSLRRALDGGEGVGVACLRDTVVALSGVFECLNAQPSRPTRMGSTAAAVVVVRMGPDAVVLEVYIPSVGGVVVTGLDEEAARDTGVPPCAECVVRGCPCGQCPTPGDAMLPTGGAMRHYESSAHFRAGPPGPARPPSRLA